MICKVLKVAIATCTLSCAFLFGDQDLKVDKLSTEEVAKLSEAFGHLIGKNIGNPNGIHLDIEKVIKGIREGAQGKSSPLSDEEVEKLMTRLQIQTFMEMSNNNLKLANEFIEKNAKEKNIVVVEPKKLHYIVLQTGKGAEVKEGDSPEILYTGKLLNGDVFDSTDAQGESMVIPLNQTIPGFKKGILGMHEGEKRRLFIHPDLGYGTAGQLPPNSLLIFEIEVVKANVDKGDKGLDDESEDDSESLSLDFEPDEFDE